MLIIQHTDIIEGPKLIYKNKISGIQIEVPILNDIATPDEIESLKKRVIAQFVDVIKDDALKHLNKEIAFFEWSKRKSFFLKQARNNIKNFAIDQRLNYSDQLFQIHLHFLSAAISSQCNLIRFHKNMQQLVYHINTDCVKMQLPIN